MHKLYTLAIAGLLTLSANAAFAQSQDAPAVDDVATPPAESTVLVYLGKEKRTVTFPSVKRTEWTGAKTDSKFEGNSK